MTDDRTPGTATGARRRMLSALPDTIASAGTGAIDWAVTGTPSAGAAAPLLAALVRFGADSLTNRQRRGARTLDTAAEQVGGLDRLAELATADEACLELTARVIEAAMRTVREQKVKALGRVLANGLDGLATVDESHILTAAIDVIEAPHLIVLRHLNENPLPPAGLLSEGEEMPSGWRGELLALAIPEIAGVVEGLAAVLAGQGLIRDARGKTFADLTGSAVWGITHLGQRCLSLLDAQGARSNPV